MLSTLLLRHRLTAAASSQTRSPLRVLVAASMSSSASSSAPHGGRKPNRLAAEHSPYLLQHAHNPVDWYPWGEEAFQKARALDVPIFLSIGYSTCHWCHVMEVESFENEEVAKLLNDWFVSIKVVFVLKLDHHTLFRFILHVDREERPDVDKVYMTYVSALHGGGGWPLSVFLSPNLKPLMGGTYFPPDDKYGRPGFKTVLRKVKEAWETKRDALEQTGNLVIEQLRDALSAKASSQDLPNDLAVVSLDQCVEKLVSSYDPKFGGFGSAPKFPRPVEDSIMLYKFRKHMEAGKESEAQNIKKMVTHTLDCMARGGVHDHVGGGFHRYSVDECWHVPHFEKMLYDQGQIVNVYLDTFLITGDEYYSTVARDILDYLRRDMIGKEGEIFSAEDADSAEYEGAPRKKEGSFYVWTSKEIEDTLGENTELFKNHYYVKSSGNCDLSPMSDPHNEFNGKNVLIERKPASLMASKFGKSLDEYSQILGACRQKLFDIRSKRPKPHLDDKVIVSWNGLAISAFARASQILKSEPTGARFNFPVTGCSPVEYLEVAEKAANFIKLNLYDASSKRLHHSYRNGPSKAPGFLDDYAFLINGLLDLYEFGGKIEWLLWAIQLQDELFLDKQGGGYFNTPGEDPSVLLRIKEDYDGAEPSGNSVAAINLIRLSSIFDAAKSTGYKHNVEHLLAVFETRLRQLSIALPLMCCAADMLSVASRKQVVLVGQKGSAEFQDMVAATFSSYDPNRTVIQIDLRNTDEMEFWDSTNANIAQMARSSPVGKKAVAHVCQDFKCSPPVTSPEALHQLLNKTVAAASSAA
ncbi:Spermatogenesis-associated protein 20 [Dichanthelium oligosanthes]|uniref:Spermatogenesis-associated protein 20 n=1 Tax=Dichanthelium oligosanthes TaxID=888268 RepID=A0A1E5UY40_9POAL|nr:Spermatogenesis-associated protein 20 [Dichanthelium oligosanthes]